MSSPREETDELESVGSPSDPLEDPPTGESGSEEEPQPTPPGAPPTGFKAPLDRVRIETHLHEWHHRLRKSEKAHYRSASVCRVWNFLRFPERAEKHRGVAVRFGALKHAAERLIVVPPEDAELVKGILALEEGDRSIREDAPSSGTLSFWWIGRRLKRERLAKKAAAK